MPPSGSADVDDYNLSQILVIEVGMGDARSMLSGPCEPAHPRFACPNRHHHGIDFKNPFTMSKRVVFDPKPLPCDSGTVVFISRYVARGGAYRDRTDDLMLAKQPLSQLS